MTMPYAGERPSRGELHAMLRRAQGSACSTLRRRAGWSPTRDLDVCACGATLLEHAARLAADAIEAQERADPPLSPEERRLRTKLRHVREEVRHLNRALTIERLINHRAQLATQVARHEREAERRQYVAWSRGGWYQPLREWYRYRQGETFPGSRGWRYFRWLPPWPRAWFPQP